MIGIFAINDIQAYFFHEFKQKINELLTINKIFSIYFKNYTHYPKHLNNFINSNLSV